MLPFLLTYAPVIHKVTLALGQSFPRNARLHPLGITGDGTIRLDGKQVDLVELGKRLERIRTLSDDWIDFRPDPNVRYEAFLEMFAVTKRSYVARLRLEDTVAFAQALDEN